MYRTIISTLAALSLLVLSCIHVTPARAAQTLDIGLTTGGAQLDALLVDARRKGALTIALVGGLQGDDASAAAVRAAVAAHEKQRQRAVRLLAVPVANPERVALAFPPSGIAYREHSEAHTLWRWLGAQAPDLVLVAGGGADNLIAALNEQNVADMGRIPARHWDGSTDWLVQAGNIAKSAAHMERDRRLTRTPRQLATELAQHYGHEFDQPLYIQAIALIARARLGEVDDVKHLVEPYVNGTKDALAKPSALTMAGHIVFTDLARRTDDARYVAAVRKVADLGFDTSGQMLEAMPYHGEYSDSVFMGTTILAQAGALTGERRYFDMADRHLRFMEKLVLRPDGLYRHQPSADAAWGRGNGFAAIGLALTLSDFPREHPAYAHALQSYRALMAALLPLQTSDGLWRNVVNRPGTFAEFSGTAMIGFAMQRGLQKGWLRGRDYRRAVKQAWNAVNARTSSMGTFIDVCESTARMTSADDYLKRAAILGMDPRGAAMAMLFATELMEK
jgi:unsaturated rhamnogalacturonyl hydrolase